MMRVVGRGWTAAFETRQDGYHFVRFCLHGRPKFDVPFRPGAEEDALRAFTSTTAADLNAGRRPKPR